MKKYNFRLKRIGALLQAGIVLMSAGGCVQTKKDNDEQSKVDSSIVDIEPSGVSEIKTGASIQMIDSTTGNTVLFADVLIRDENGVEVDTIYIANNINYIELSPGNYIVEEIGAPLGYKIITKNVNFEVKENEITTVEMKTEQINKEIMNEDNNISSIRTGILISNNDELSGNILDIKDSDGKEVTRLITIQNPYYVELEPGKYTVTEIYSQDEYNQSEETKSFEVKENEITNVILDSKPRKIGVNVSNVDAITEKELPGTTLVIRDVNGNEKASWISTTEPRFIELESGKYTLSESAVSEGYKQTVKTISFTVRESGKNETVKMFNDPYVQGIRISNVDVDTKEEVPGMILSIKDVSERVICQWLSTDEVKYIELEIGKYTLSVTDLLEEYEKIEQIIPFSVEKDEITDVVVEHILSEEKNKVKLR